MNLAQGKIVLALEGGYNLDSIANSMLACAELLLDGRTVNKSSETYPFESTWQVIQAVSSLIFFTVLLLFYLGLVGATSSRQLIFSCFGYSSTFLFHKCF